MSADPTASTALTPAAVVSEALATQDGALRALLEGTGVSVMKFRQDVLLTLAKTPQLQAVARTEQGARSLVAAAVDAAQLGLRVGSTLGHAALVPYKGEIKLIVQYQGKVELALKSGLVATISRGYACEHDEFDYLEGSDGHIRHRRNLKGHRGAIIAGYAVATYPNGMTVVHVTDRDEAMRARQKSAGYRVAYEKNQQSPDHPWHNNEGEMWAKTAVHRLSKSLPKSPKLRDLEDAGRVIVDDDSAAPDSEPTAGRGRVVDDTGEAGPAAVRVAAEIQRADGSVVDTATGEVTPQSEPWAMTPELWEEIQRDAAEAGIRNFAGEVHALGLPAEGRKFSREQYRLFRLHVDRALAAKRGYPQIGF